MQEFKGRIYSAVTEEDFTRAVQHIEWNLPEQECAIIYLITRVPERSENIKWSTPELYLRPFHLSEIKMVQRYAKIMLGRTYISWVKPALIIPVNSGHPKVIPVNSAHLKHK